MSRQRAQAIIIQNDNMLFGYGYVGERGLRHFFIGGGIEEGETPEQAVLREISEETNTHGKILFKFSNELKKNHHTFLVDIGEQKVSLGYDPEEIAIEEDKKSLQQLIWINLNNINEFTEIDTEYIKLLIQECNTQKYHPNWVNKLDYIINK